MSAKNENMIDKTTKSSKKKWTTPVLDQHAFIDTRTAKPTTLFGEGGPTIGPAS